MVIIVCNCFHACDHIVTILSAFLFRLEIAL